MSRSDRNRAILLTRGVLRDWPLPRPAEDGDKQGRGTAFLVGGSREMPGAMVFSATAGSGDVLSGIIAGLLARGADPLQAAAWAVALHARAGDRLALRTGPLGCLAREIPGELPRLMRTLARG